MADPLQGGGVCYPTNLSLLLSIAGTKPGDYVKYGSDDWKLMPEMYPTYCNSISNTITTTTSSLYNAIAHHIISCFQTIDSQRYPHQCVPETFHYDGKYYSEEGVSIVHNKHRYHTRFHSDILFYFILFYLIFSIYDAFYETGLQDELKGAEVKTVIIAGV